MAATVSWDGLRDLAGFRAEKGCAISLYLDLDPSVTPTAGDVDSRMRSLVDQAAKDDRRDLSHEQREALKADFDRIRDYFEQDFDRDGSHGLAIFSAALDNVWHPLPLSQRVDDRIKIGREFHLAPLVPLVGRGEGALVVAIGRERGDIYRLRAGRLEEVANLRDETPGHHDQGGWSQARFQRHIEELAARHVRSVTDELDRQVRRLRGPRVVVVAAEEMRPEIESALTSEARKAIVGWAQAEAHATAAELLDVAQPVLESWRVEQERDAVERWREEAGRNARAASGWADTLEAASDGRVELLLFQDGAEHAAWQCPACGRLGLAGGSCPLDGTRMEERAEGLDLAVHQALAHGGTVLALQHHRDLDPVEGIGALLRF